MILPNDATTYVAIYGAGLASLTFVWNVTSWWRDRGKLRVHLHAFKLRNEGRWQVDVRFHVTNVGRKSILVMRPGALTAERRNVDLNVLATADQPLPLPRRLEPDDYVVIWPGTPRDPLYTAKRVYVVDSIGRRWYAPRKDLRQLRELLSAVETMNRAELPSNNP